MLYRKEGLPEEGQIVLCTVTKIQFHSVFVKLEEYDKEGMIHISEIAAGRIRNMRDYVREDKLVVCKVLRVDKERGSIDLSLRRVTEKQKREKIEWMKKEQLAEKIVENTAFQLKQDFAQLYEKITANVFKSYEELSSCFQKVALGEESLENLGIEKGLSETLTKLIIQRIKPEYVDIKGVLKLTSFLPNGVEVIKEAVKRGIETNSKKTVQIDVKYAGAGSYNVKVTAEEYKTAEQALKKLTDAIIRYMEKNNGEADFIREE